MSFDHQMFLKHFVLLRSPFPWEIVCIFFGITFVVNLNFVLFFRVYDVNSGKQTRTFKGTPGDDGTLVRVYEPDT